MDQMEMPLFDPISIPGNGKGTYSCDVKQESDLIKSFDVNDSRFERAKLKKFSCVNKSSAKCLNTFFCPIILQIYLKKWKSKNGMRGIWPHKWIKEA